MVTKEDIKEVYLSLKEREIHPTGTFDKQGRWYAKHRELICVRSPSKAYPYSELLACRTHKYVEAIAEKCQPTTIEELRRLV